MQNALIVDDKEEGLYFLQCLLSANGFRVTTASNGKEALERAEELRPDIVISDILMPVMDGFTLCRQWKHNPQFASIPFIFYTATYTDERDEEFALSLGADLFMVKPQEPEQFIQTIRAFLEKFDKGDSHRKPGNCAEESVYLQSYNSALIRKLENKVSELEKANEALGIKDFAIASSIAGIVMADLCGAITYVNPSFAKMWGYECSELIGKPILTLAGEQSAMSGIVDIVRTEGRWIGELRAVRKNGEPFTSQMTAHIVTGLQNTPICLMASCIDITEHRRLQEESQRTQNLESLSIFAAGIAHDFNNLLTGLFNSLELAKDDLPPDSAAQKHFAVAISIFERARALSQSLLTFAKGGSTVRRAVDISNVIRESCAISLSGASIRHEFAADDPLEPVEANANQLSQVFTNLILNARQAMADKGALKISACNCELKPGQIGSLPGGKYVAIRLEDSGPGIPEKLIPRIFDPFFTTKEEGSGLGLATSYSIVKNHGGHIQVSSRTGKGAKFEIWLPACQEEQITARSTAVSDIAKGSGRILVMDDEKDICNIAQTMLGRAGYDVAGAPDGKEALAQYSMALSAGNPFDLVILDLTVRGGMGGEETITELLKINPRVVAIASTGYSNSMALSQLKQRGFAGLLPKPYSKYELLSVVKSATSKLQVSGKD